MSAETAADRARRLLEGTTEGPWTADDDGVIETGDGTPVGFVHRHGCIHTVRATGEPCSRADGRLMAAAPAVARDLIAESEAHEVTRAALAAVERERDEARAERDALQGRWCLACGGTGQGLGLHPCDACQGGAR